MKRLNKQFLHSSATRLRPFICLLLGLTGVFLALLGLRRTSAAEGLHHYHVRRPPRSCRI